MQGLARSVHSNSIENAGGDTSRSYHRCSAMDVANEWETSLERGLATSEVERRLRHYGPNRLQGGKVVRWYEVLRRQFVDVLIAILLIAALVSLAVGEIADAVTIFAIVLLNGLLGFVQEWKAERSLVALREMLTPTCRVIRDGNEQTVDANTLVPGRYRFV
ncbi:MAG: cation-transporting P-type ATPase [Rhodopirellula sp. JB044]|uniref:cation-transporting P-type ATPase n=1 Tax=Rhodopirellula sp. JB044 TaxID=3342844 RepID=UPI00370AA349